VEAVDTAEHWPAAYLPDAGIPIVRGWYRQSDFPQNELLYDPKTMLLFGDAKESLSKVVTSVKNL